MGNTYWNHKGKYQSQYDKILQNININIENLGQLVLIQIAGELYIEYHKNKNQNFNKEWVKYTYKIDTITYFIPQSRDIIKSIIDKIADDEISEETDRLYEELMDCVIEYAMNKINLRLNIREHFKVEFEDIIDLCRIPEYRYILRVGINKGTMTGLSTMSLDELDKLADTIKEFVKSKR